MTNLHKVDPVLKKRKITGGHKSGEDKAAREGRSGSEENEDRRSAQAAKWASRCLPKGCNATRSVNANEKGSERKEVFFSTQNSDIKTASLRKKRKRSCKATK